jgi:hypothetical protein
LCMCVSFYILFKYYCRWIQFEFTTCPSIFWTNKADWELFRIYCCFKETWHKALVSTKPNHFSQIFIHVSCTELGFYVE